MKLSDVLLEFEDRLVYWIEPGGEGTIAAPLGAYHWTAILMEPEKFGFEADKFASDIDVYMQSTDWFDKDMKKLAEIPFTSWTDQQKFHFSNVTLDNGECEKYVHEVLDRGFVRLYYITSVDRQLHKFKMQTLEVTKQVAKTIEMFCKRYTENQTRFEFAPKTEITLIAYHGGRPVEETSVEAILRGFLDNVNESISDIPAGRFFYGWLSPAAELIDLKDSGTDFHFVYITKHPEMFGFSEKEMQEYAAQYYSAFKSKARSAANPDWDDIRDTQLADTVMEKAFERGWIRISFDFTDWSAFCYRLDEKTKRLLEKFSNGLISNKYPVPAFFCSSRLDMRIYPLITPPEEVTMELGQISRGLLEESMKLNDIALVEEITTMSVGSNAAGDRTRKIDDEPVKVQCCPGAWIECIDTMNVCPECLAGFDDDGERVVDGVQDMDAVAEAVSPEMRKKLSKQYDANEDENRHSENALLLAKHFGTIDEHTKAADLLFQRTKLGHAPDEAIKFQYEMSQKYYKKLHESALNELVDVPKDTDDEGYWKQPRKLIHAKTGKEIKVGDQIPYTNHHTGETSTVTVKGLEPPHKPSSSGFVTTDEGRYYAHVYDAKYVQEADEGLNGYVCFYKGKRLEVYAKTSYEAQKKAAEQFKAKKSYEVSVTLAEKDGKPVTHIATESVNEEFWSKPVTDEAKHHPKAGLYATGSAEAIAKSETSQQINFYLQRAGSNLSAERRATIKRALDMKEKK